MLWQTAATEGDLARRLHPRLRSWFRKSFQKFTHAQLLAVPAILDRQSILLTSPTGSGKTLAGFLGTFDFHGPRSNFELVQARTEHPAT